MMWWLFLTWFLYVVCVRLKETIKTLSNRYIVIMLGTNKEMQHQEPSEEEMTYEGDVDENNISREVIKLALKEMENGKSPVCDEIPAKLLTGSEDMIALLHRLFSRARTEGRVTKEWDKAIMCPIYKKEDKR